MEKIIEALQDVFERYSSKGVLAIYLYGSVIRDDFDPQTSDVDSLAIVDDTAPLDGQSEIRKFLKETYPEINDFRINYLYGI